MKNMLNLLGCLFLSFLVFSCQEEQMSDTFEANPVDQQMEFLDDAALAKALAIEHEIGTRTHSSTVFTMSNKSDGNEVISFNIDADGSITQKDQTSTDGTGTDSDLGGHGSMTTGLNGKLLYTVNPGSNDFSVFYVKTDGGLILKDKISSGGTKPVSITEHNSIIYVLNAGGDGNIAGFGYNDAAELVPISNSVKPLSTDASDGAQIKFSPDGKVLVITEKATNTITTYKLWANRPTTMNTTTTAGTTPMGFDFGSNNKLFVSEASSDMTDASTISSYSLDTDNGKVTLLDGPVALNKTSSCFIVTNKNKKTVYTTNLGSSDMSTIDASGFGKLTVVNTTVAPAINAPSDAAMDNDSKFMYVLSKGDKSIVTLSVDDDGDLVKIDSDGNLPDFMAGLTVN